MPEEITQMVVQQKQSVSVASPESCFHRFIERILGSSQRKSYVLVFLKKSAAFEVLQRHWNQAKVDPFC
jgi:hypothetical protein